MTQMNEALQTDTEFSIDVIYDLRETEVGYVVVGNDTEYRYAEFPENEQAEDYIEFLKDKSETN